MKILISSLILVALTLSQDINGASLDEGVSAAQRGDFVTAFEHLLPLAEEGNSDAQYLVGSLYRFGEGASQDDREAVKWFRLAAEQGHTEAQTFLGVMYAEGRGVAKSSSEALKWLERAADWGEVKAQVLLGEIYSNGIGVPANKNLAMKWYRYAAEQGDPKAQTYLGWQYEHGYAVTKNDQLAAKWYRLAAEQGYGLARSRLEAMGFGWTQSEPAVDDAEQVKELKTLLAKLEAEKIPTEQSISQDTQRPSILITSTNSDGARGIISGVATDNTGIAEVLIDGEAVVVDSGGRFNASTFIPSGGIEVQITAYDLKGLSTTETVRLERSQRIQQVSRLAAVNPLVGPKQKPSRDRAALIIGVEDYARAPSADYASGDATMFADYAREKLGISDNNVKVLSDTGASKAEILRALKVWLPKAVKPDTTDLYVFYAGHGMPTADGTSAYLVPYDGDIQLLEDTAISRKRFFDEISATKPRSATFFFDNCYSGATRSEQQLLAARPLTIKVEETDVPDNYLVFTAGETDQIAGVEPEVKHGRFSYFVFKGLEGEADANQDGKISAGELHAYVRESVGRFSAGAQTPTMLGDAGRWVLR